MEFIDNDFVIPGYVAELLNKITQERGFTSFSTNVSSDANAKDGFNGIICRIKLIGVKSEKGLNVTETVNLIAKFLPDNKSRNPMASFKREIKLYEEILPDFVKFQEEKKIKPEDGFFNFPKCYGTYYNEGTEESVILLEDVTSKSYEMWDKIKPVEFEHAKLLMEQLGKYHAISFAMKDQEPKRFEKCSSLKDNFLLSKKDKIDENDFISTMFKQSCIKASETLETFEDYKENKMLKFKENFYSFLKSYDDTDKFEPFAVLIHGDCWSNNMMYQYDGTRTADKICILDWQLSRYTSPVLDIVYFIFTSTDKQLRAEHYKNLIRIYYKHLSQHLTRLGSNPEKLFTFNDLLDQLKRFGHYGLLMSTMLMPMITAKAVLDPKELNVVYKSRMSDIIRDVVRLGYY